MNGVNGSKDGYDATVSGVADGFLVMDLQTIGETAVKLAGSLIKGEKVERTNLIPGVIIPMKMQRLIKINLGRKIN